MKSSVPNVFISSTCYDLAQIRIDLYDFFDSLGLKAILSEHKSFPVQPGNPILDNCIDAVKENTDIFILIVGGRYGSTIDSGTSITNIEYLTAVQYQIPTYIFINREISNYYNIWLKSPKADFSSYVDSTKIFEFIKDIKTKNTNWIYDFTNANDIKATLKLQIAYLFNSSLALWKKASVNQDKILLSSCSSDALRIIMSEPANYEMRVFIQFLKDEIDKYKEDLLDLKYEIRYKIPRSFEDQKEISKYLKTKMDFISSFSFSLTKLINNAYAEFYAEPGIQSDINGLYYVAKRFGLIYKLTIDWVLDLRSIVIEEKYISLFKAMENIGTEFILCISGIIDKFEDTANDVEERYRKGERKTIVKKTIDIEIPKKIFTHLNREIDKLS